MILDIYPPEKRGSALAIWAMSTLAAPVLGPVLGGWLTDNFNWRWVFYINLPFGVLTTIGVLLFVPRDRGPEGRPFDLMGFLLFATMLASLQLFLDRGQIRDWLQSPEIVAYASISLVALILFVIHTLTTPRPFLRLELLADRNFVTATLIGLLVGVLVFSALSLLPPMIEDLMGYPVMDAGLAMAPRGFGSVISSLIAGRLVSRVDNRLIVAAGMMLFATTFYGMGRFSLQMDAFGIAWTGFVQGLGTGFMFMPLTVLAFTSLDPAYRADGTGFFTLVRNMGSSGGISVMQALYIRDTQRVHSSLVEHLRPDNPIAQAPYLSAPYSLSNPMGMAALDGEVTRQASMVAYVHVFHLMFLVTLVSAPMVLLLRRPAPAATA
jgi:DHA2 family multidrug resistance protein